LVAFERLHKIPFFCKQYVGKMHVSKLDTLVENWQVRGRHRTSQELGISCSAGGAGPSRIAAIGAG